MLNAQINRRIYYKFNMLFYYQERPSRELFDVKKICQMLKRMRDAHKKCSFASSANKKIKQLFDLRPREKFYFNFYEIYQYYVCTAIHIFLDKKLHRGAHYLIVTSAI